MAHAKQVFESPDLVRMIYSFGDPSHRTFTSQLKFRLKPLSDNFEYNYYERALLEGEYYTVEDYLSNYLIREIEYYLKEYERCFCCARHSRDRPRWIHRSSVYVPQYVFESHPNVIVHVEHCLGSLSSISIRMIGRILKLIQPVFDPVRKHGPRKGTLLVTDWRWISF